MIREVFSKRLQILRAKKGVSLAALGQYLGVTDEAVRLLERGKRSPSFEILYALAVYFEVPADYLVGNSGANFTQANLTRANLTDAKACGAIFVEANLTGANLSGADLRWADFSHAILKGANLDGAKLEGAIFEGADVSDTILEGKVIDEKYY